jgi:hypothetical protein
VSLREQARVQDARDSATFREAARSLREMLDRGGHQGITPAAMFALCAMLDTAVNTDPTLTPQPRRDLLNTAAEIRDRQASTPQAPPGEVYLL